VTCVDGATPKEIVDLEPDRSATPIGHELHGIDQPVEPHRLLVTGSALWAAWLDYRPGATPEVLIGLGTSGIIPTVAVAIAAGLPYHLARRLDGDVSDEIPGTRRGGFLVSGRLRGKRVLVVDDEVTDGHTLASFVVALRDEGAEVVGTLCLTEAADGTGRSRVESTGIPLCAVNKRQL
jgi:adenine phosphoribosyltransferase